MNISELVKEAHDNAVNHGFYDSPIYGTPGVDDKNIGELLMLVVSELGEALEAHRKGKVICISGCVIDDVQKGLNENNANAIKLFEDNFKDSLQDELADAVIRIADMCGYLGIDLEKHIELKMKYNETREYKHGKRY